MKRTIIRFLKVLGPFRGVILAMLGYLFLQELVTMAAPAIYGRFIDALVARQSFSRLLSIAGVWLAVGIAENLIAYAKWMFEMKKFDFAFPRHLSRITLTRFLGFSVGQHTNQHSGVQQNVINEGESSLSSMAMMLIYNILPPVLKAVAVTLYLFWVSHYLGWIILIGILAYAGLAIQMHRKIATQFKDFQEMRHEKHRLHSEIIRNPDLIELNAKEKYSVELYDENMREFGDKGMALWAKFVRWTYFAQGSVPSITNYAVILTGAWLVFYDTLTPGRLVTVMAFSSIAMSGLRSLSQMQRQLSEEWAKISKYFVMMDVEPDIQVVANPIQPKNYEGAIEFRDVVFSYPFRSYMEDDKPKTTEGKSDEPVLGGVNVFIRKGERVALVGKNGAGKSTFFHLLMRSFDPDRGQVLIDGNDMRLIDLDHYRKHGVGYVEQEVRLLDSSLRENVLFGLNGQRASLTENEIDRVLAISRMHSFLPRMEKGLDTLIGEKGIKLSGGQRKMVGIARAIIKDPAILLFDEATAGLDQEEEALLYESLGQASSGRTTLVITHRLSTVKNVDRILVLEKGLIVGDGKHTELISSCLPYQDLIRRQIASF